MQKSLVYRFISQVSLCGGCNVFRPYAAFVVGIVAGMIYIALNITILKLHIDDPLDAVAGQFDR